MTSSALSLVFGIIGVWFNLQSLSFASIYSLRPEAGQVIPASEPFNIIWETDSASAVQIELSYGHNVKVGNITASTPNSGSYLWTPDSGLAGSFDYFLAICPLNAPDDGCAYTYNGRFTIVSQSATTSVTPSPSQSESTSSTKPSSSPSESNLSDPSSSQLENTSSPQLLSQPESTPITLLPSQSGSASSAQTSFSTTDSSIQALTTTVEITATAPATSYTPTSSPPSYHDGLSRGAIIAICVVIPVFVIAAATASLLFIILRRRRTRAEGTPRPWRPTPGKKYQKAELPSDNIRAELDATPANLVHELG